MSSELLQYRYDVLASLYWMPCTIKELAERDFCNHLPLWYIDQILLKLQNMGLVFQSKDGIWRTRRNKAKRLLNVRGYEID